MRRLSRVDGESGGLRSNNESLVPYNTENNDQFVAAIKSKADRKPLRNRDRINAMLLDRVLNRSVFGQAPSPLTVNATEKKPKKMNPSKPRKPTG